MNNTKVVSKARWGAPLILRTLLVVCLALVGFFFMSLRTGEQRYSQATQTLGQDATAGIVAAQRIKSSLEEMHTLVGQVLLNKIPANEPTLLQQYADERRDVTESLVKASERVVYGPAQEVPLSYEIRVLANYHTAVAAAIAAHDRGDDANALAAYHQASDLMSKTLLPAADQLDKASNYALNRTYLDEQALSNSTSNQVLISGGLLLALLLGMQLFCARHFHRVINLPMMAATLVAGIYLGYANIQFSTITSSLTSAKDENFDSVHLLARAKAMSFEVRRSEIEMLLDPAHAADHRRAFTSASQKIILLPEGAGFDDQVHALSLGTVSDELSGYLATEMRTSVLNHQSVNTDSVAAFGRYVSSVTDAKRPDVLLAANLAGTQQQLFDAFLTSLDKASASHAEQFALKAETAQSALASIAPWRNIVVCLAIVLLIYFGIAARLKEYKAAS